MKEEKKGTIIPQVYYLRDVFACLPVSVLTSIQMCSLGSEWP